MNTKKHYYWDEDTINHFQFLSSYTSGEEVYNEIQEFVENNCEIEENEVIGDAASVKKADKAAIKKRMSKK